MDTYATHPCPTPLSCPASCLDPRCEGLPLAWAEAASGPGGASHPAVGLPGLASDPGGRGEAQDGSELAQGKHYPDDDS